MNTTQSPGNGNSIWQVRGMKPYLAVAFLNAFTDIGHKIIIHNTIFKHYQGAHQMALAAVINAFILLPFVLTFTPAGYLSDKFPKNKVTRASAALAIPITIGIYLCYGTGSFRLAFSMTLLLALQSAIYSPAKYGFLKELAGKENLAAGNGALQAVTIAAILSSTLAYSIVFEFFFQAGSPSPGATLKAVQPAGLFLIGCVVLETFLSGWLPQKHKTRLDLRFEWRKYLGLEYFRSNIQGVWRSSVICWSILGLGVFWAVNQVVLASFPAFLKEVTHESNTIIAQGIVALAAVGIIAGSLFAGRYAGKGIGLGLVPAGAAGMSGLLLALPFLESFILLVAFCLLYGFFGGLYIVPLNALMQFHARGGQLGTVLAGKNYIHNWLMLAFLGGSIGFTFTGLPLRLVFFILFLVMLLGTGITVLQFSRSLIPFFLRTGKLRVSGVRHIPSDGPVLLTGHIAGNKDWFVLQQACPRMITVCSGRPVLSAVKFFGGIRLLRLCTASGLEEMQAFMKTHFENGGAAAVSREEYDPFPGSGNGLGLDTPGKPALIGFEIKVSGPGRPVHVDFSPV